MIDITNLSYKIGETTILHDISLSIPSGGITALVGPNGAGKSTMLSLIARLLPLQGGTILIDDLPVDQTPSDLLARKMAILPQRMHVSTRLTVKELVTFGRYPHSKGRLTKDDHTHIAHSIELFDLSLLADRQIDTLSGGQRQKCFLAMAFAQDTDYLLLDEPLNNLDIAATRSLMRILSDLSRSHQKTIVIVVHDINVAARYADTMVALRDGQCVVSGSPQDTITEGFMQSIYGTDAEVVTLAGRPVVLV